MWTTTMKDATAHPNARDFRIICDCQREHRRATRLRRASRFATWGVVAALGVGTFVSPLGASIPSMDSILKGARIWIASDSTVSLPSIEPTPARPHWHDSELTTDIIRDAFFRTQVPYGEIILKESKRNDLPPELVAAVVETESDFRPKLVSHANAHGLMQIIPSTGKLMGASDLFNPHDNIRTGTKYLRYLHDLYEGDRTMTLAAYNAGLGNVQKYGGVPPFRETQNYVVRVASSKSEYDRRIRESAAKWNRLALRIRD